MSREWVLFGEPGEWSEEFPLEGICPGASWMLNPSRQRKETVYLSVRGDDPAGSLRVWRSGHDGLPPLVTSRNGWVDLGGGLQVRIMGTDVFGSIRFRHTDERHVTDRVEWQRHQIYGSFA